MNQTNNAVLWKEFIKAINTEVKPALGCTEPVSLALASAIAASYTDGNIERIDAKVSANLMKNGMGVTVPGTGTVGLKIAAAVGALGGDAKGGLEVLKQLDDKVVAAGKAMIEADKVSVSIADCEQILYSEANVYSGNDVVRVVIADQHTQVVRIEKNGEVLFMLDAGNDADNDPAYCLDNATAESVYTFATTAPIEQIEFILEAGEINDALSQEGLSKEYGLRIGVTLQNSIKSGLLSEDLLTQILVRTSAASDARMGGATLRAMSNSGSGNQGIMATMPVVVMADYLKVDKEKRARALMLSHLMAVYIHSKLPKLSALCAVSTAGMGAASAMAWLMLGNFNAVTMVINSMIGDLSGMICDGASNSCTMKVSSSCTSAVKALLMAQANICVTGNEGIVAHDVECSINNLCALACDSMQKTDVQIIDIMTHKAS